MTSPVLYQPTSVPALASRQVDYLLLDASSSMAHQWSDCCHALDTYVCELDLLGVSSDVFLATFTTAPGGLAFHVQRECSPKTWDPTHSYPLHFEMGSTPLNDAINAMGRHLQELAPQKCSIVIATDGEENTSKTSTVQARAVLDWARAQGWQITFIGCDFNNLNVAGELGATASEAAGTSTKNLPPLMKMLAKKRKAYADSDADIAFSNDEKSQFGGYLSPPGR